jgi:hypothetical protein
MIVLKIYEAHYLTLTAGPNLTTGTIKEKTQSKSYFYDSLSGPLQKIAQETFCYGDVLLQETFRYGDVLLRRRCVYRRFVWRRFVWRRFVRNPFFPLKVCCFKATVH